MSKGNSHFAQYAIGFVVGAVALPVLKSGVAKKAFTYLTAGGFIARDYILEEAENIHASALDISEDAKVITERYYQEKDRAYEAAAETAAEEEV